MSVNSILGTAQAGMQSGLNGLKKNAAEIASKDALQGTGDDSTPQKSVPVEPLVDMKMNKYQVLSSGKVVETVDEMLGSLLDEKA